MSESAASQQGSFFPNALIMEHEFTYQDQQKNMDAFLICDLY